jgi:hypothetical protein
MVPQSRLNFEEKKIGEKWSGRGITEAEKNKNRER